MHYEIKILEPTDLWYLQNNINKDTNKFHHPTKQIPLIQQVEISLENSGVILQKGALHHCMGKLTYDIYKTDNRLKDLWVALRSDVEFNAPVYKGTGKVYLEARGKGNFFYYTDIDAAENEQWEFDDGIFQFCSANVVIGTKKLKFRQMLGGGDGRWRTAIRGIPGQPAKIVTATLAPGRVVELKPGEVIIADCDLVKGFTNGIQEDYRSLGHFGKGGGEGYVWVYTGTGRLLISEREGMGLG